ncbi:hypothetical protein BD289DRAFT_485417 [Coniella lustricola]|uniref:Erythromycin esterase n=1 Tax=Coniella lustricola TaxID=2025994 RepID=A0A2T2ZYT6_9PEZI|nr:hypothetical protein BD289DRAFT_485417 [Coniella lustricola]
MARRRSARLASVATTPKKEDTGDFEPVVKQAEHTSDHKASKKLRATMSSPAQGPRTPMGATVIKPPMSEMHPSKAHVGTMPAPSSALRLGFTDIKPQNGCAKGSGPFLSTPSKTNMSSSPLAPKSAHKAATNSNQTFGADAQKIMEEIREEAAKIKAGLIAKREQERLEEAQASTRKIAQPKRKSGRFSEVHMAEFKKMDSIANHPSAFRASHDRAATAIESTSKGRKRSQSNANIDTSETPLSITPASTLTLKSTKMSRASGKASKSPAKRAKQSPDDDASTNRPASRDEGKITQPKTPRKDARRTHHAKTPTRLTPIPSSLAHAAFTQSVGLRSILKQSTGQGQALNITEANLIDIPMGDESIDMQGTSLSDRVKSILAKYQDPAQLSQSMGGSKTPGPARTQVELPPAPFTTSGKKLSRRVNFNTAPKLAALTQNSPSVVKTGISGSKAGNFVPYPSLKKATESTSGDAFSYPDLSSVLPLSEKATPTDAIFTDKSSNTETQDAVNVPGTFTFRSDRTISFDSESHKGFGVNKGQASIRRVRPSTASTVNVFPTTKPPMTAAPQGKENVRPQSQKVYDAKAFAHGVSSKKRCRVEDDEQEAEREAAERAVKKKRSAAVPEGDALLAPRLTAARRNPAFKAPTKFIKRSPVKTNSAAGATGQPKKPSTLSVSRLAYLAQPKRRK